MVKISRTHYVTRKGKIKRNPSKRVIQMKRVMAEEGDGVALWFESIEPNNQYPRFVASIVKGEFSKRLGIWETWGRLNADGTFLPEIAFVGADFNKVRDRVESYKKSIEMHYARRGYNVRIR